MIWFAGTSSLCVVKMSDLSVTEIKGFLPVYSKDYAMATRCVAKDDATIIFVSFVFKNKFNFCFYTKGREPDNHLISDILKESKFNFFSKKKYFLLKYFKNFLYNKKINVFFKLKKFIQWT